jgi:hypothetical protein
MPFLQCHVDEDTMARLQRCASHLQRSVEDLAESAIAEAALDATRGMPDMGHEGEIKQFVAEHEQIMREEVIPQIEADQRTQARLAHFARLGIPATTGGGSVPDGVGEES